MSIRAPTAARRAATRDVAPPQGAFRRPCGAPPRRARRTIHFVAALFALAAACSPGGRARAERADDNAVTAASDAFGTVVGNQTIGLYNPSNARGFSPTQAENLRIEGLYYDQQPQSSNPYLFSGSDMRVGIAAQSYAFPSPSGIADYRLRIPGNSAAASAVLQRGPLRQFLAEVDTQFPLVQDVVSVGINVGDGEDFDYYFATKSKKRAVSVLARIQPSPTTEIVPFFGYVYNTERRETPFVYATGTDGVPFFQEQDLPTQPWTTWAWNQVTAGVIARVALAGPWSVRGGLFRSLDENSTNFNDVLLGLRPDGTGERVFDVVPSRRSGSFSGDLRLMRTVVDGGHRRELTFAVRGRLVDRGYGGDSVSAPQEISIYQNVEVPEPPIAFTGKSRDVVRHTGFGANYSESWSGIGSLSIGLLKTDYQRTITNPGLPASTDRTSELLPTLSFTAAAGKAATLYGSYTRGLEDSATAPSSAINRGESPPATSSWQADGGVRFSFDPRIQLLVGAFKVRKPFFGLSNGFYAQTGDISTTGIESSATVTSGGGLSVVAGAVWLRPTLGSGGVPVGPVPRTVSVNADYSPPGWRGWAASLQWESLSSRLETNGEPNLYSLPMANTLNVGLRYGFKSEHAKLSVRLDAANVTNVELLTVSSLYYVVPQLRRNYTLTLIVDL